MTDREKVIKGFECCHVMVHDLGPDKTSCGICPYKNVQTEEQINLGGIECIAVLHDDALAMLKEQNWISVKDRLPNCNGCYLVWRPHFYPDKGMPSICYFDGQNTWHDSYGVDFTRVLSPNDVSHWMPLPE